MPLDEYNPLGNELINRCRRREELVLKRLITALRLGTLTNEQLWSGIGEISGVRSLVEDFTTEMTKLRKGESHG